MKQYTQGLTWARFAMWRERRCVKRALRLCNLNVKSKILDIPCGAGILAEELSRTPASIVAADISLEMIALARGEYDRKNFTGFVQADITKTPFTKGEFDCTIILGFLHRVPNEIKGAALKEIASVSRRFLIVSCSVDSGPQRFKQWLIKKIKKAHKPAPEPLLLCEILTEFGTQDLFVKTAMRVVPFLSAEIVFLLIKK